MVILNEDGGNVKEELECDEATNVEDELTKKEPQEGQALDDGDPNWTPEEAESAYEQTGDNDCDKKPNPKYGYTVKLMM